MRSMKIVWLKILCTRNSTWGQVIATELPNIHEIFMFGSKKLLKIRSNINNQFWRDLLEAFATFSKAFKPELLQILSESVWYSDHTKFKLSVINVWKRNGIRFLADLINEISGKLHTKESLENAFNIKMTFLCFSNLTRSLPDELKSAVIIKEHGPHHTSRNECGIEPLQFPTCGI